MSKFENQESKPWLPKAPHFSQLVSALESGYQDTLRTEELEYKYINELKFRLGMSYAIPVTRFYVSHMTYGFHTKPFPRAKDVSPQYTRDVSELAEFRATLLFEWCSAALTFPYKVAEFDGIGGTGIQIGHAAAEIWAGRDAFPWYPKPNVSEFYVELKHLLVATALLQRLHSVHMRLDKPDGTSPFDPIDYERHGITDWTTGTWPAPHLVYS